MKFIILALWSLTSTLAVARMDGDVEQARMQSVTATLNIVGVKCQEAGMDQDGTITVQGPTILHGLNWQDISGREHYVIKNDDCLELKKQIGNALGCGGTVQKDVALNPNKISEVQFFRYEPIAQTPLCHD